jgi:hypothetical protein
MKGENKRYLTHSLSACRPHLEVGRISENGFIESFPGNIWEGCGKEGPQFGLGSNLVNSTKSKVDAGSCGASNFIGAAYGW